MLNKDGRFVSFLTLWKTKQARDVWGELCRTREQQSAAPSRPASNWELSGQRQRANEQNSLKRKGRGRGNQDGRCAHTPEALLRYSRLERGRDRHNAKLEGEKMMRWFGCRPKEIRNKLFSRVVLSVRIYSSSSSSSPITPAIVSCIYCMCIREDGALHFFRKRSDDHRVWQESSFSTARAGKFLAVRGKGNVQVFNTHTRRRRRRRRRIVSWWEIDRRCVAKPKIFELHNKTNKATTAVVGRRRFFILNILILHLDFNRLARFLVGERRR